MEQTQHWLWTKQIQYGMGSHIFPSSSTGPLLESRVGDSWEEQAFAEDAAAGALGGCIWPPRSYSCTFCKKEFRSAQALGGHMNVHRRDRARLKQSQGPQTEASPDENANNDSNLLKKGTILEAQSQQQTCNFPLSRKLKYDNRTVATTSSPIRVSSASRFDSYDNETQYLFPYVQESAIFPSKSRLNTSGKQFHFWRNLGAEPESTMPSMAEGDNIVKADFSISENPRPKLESTMTSRNNKRDIVKADLSICLNLVICSSNSSNASDYEEDERCKKRRINDPAAAVNMFYNIQDSNDVSSTNDQLQIDDVDLELRLGDPPKVK